MAQKIEQQHNKATPFTTTLRNWATGLILAFSFSAATQAAELRSSIVVEGQLVTLGDLFSDHSENTTVILRAPAPGEVKRYSAFDIERQAAENGIEWNRPAYVKNVKIERAGQPFNADDLAPFLLPHVQDYVSAENIKLRLYGVRKSLFIPLNRSLEEIMVDRFTMKDGNQRFAATLLIPEGDNEFQKMTISGALTTMRRVPVFNRSIGSGEIITSSDIAWKEMPTRRIQSYVVTHTNDLIGMTVKRTVQGNNMIRTTDVMRPLVVKKGDNVSIKLDAGLLQLVMTGKALENGALGDTIRIQNTASKRTFDAEVIGTDLAEVKMQSINLVATR